MSWVIPDGTQKSWKRWSLLITVNSFMHICWQLCFCLFLFVFFIVCFYFLLQGADWQPLNPPTDDTDCAYMSYDCKLHLLLHYYSTSHFVSEDDAVGVIMAAGNVGSCLDLTRSKMYMSRDAGITWEKVVADGKKQHFFYSVITPLHTLCDEIPCCFFTFSFLW